MGHENQVIHRDLKPTNILLTVDGVIKLADFGTSKDLSELTHTVQQTLCGTPAFIAPEVVRKDKHTTSTDIWSLGVIVYNMVTGEIPFVAAEKLALLLAIANGSVKVEYPPAFPRIFREFIHSCLKFLPADRPSAKELLQNPLFSESIPTTPETQKVAKDSIVNIVPLRSESIVSLHDIPQ